MGRIYHEDDIPWSCIEKHIPYAKVIYSTNKNGISTYMLFDKDDNRIYVNIEGPLP